MALALLAVPASASAYPKPRVLATDAAAKKALVSVARKVEACRSGTVDYTRCDAQPPLSRGVLFEASSSSTYVLSARSRPGRRFRLARGMDGSLAATCTPAGRGACPRSGIWKPAPRPVMTPAFGEEWLVHEREFLVRFDALVAAAETCRAARGTFEGCFDSPPVRGARNYVAALTGEQPQMELGTGSSYIHARAVSGTEFVVSWFADGTVDRACQKYLPHLVSPCVDGRW